MNEKYVNIMRWPLHLPELNYVKHLCEMYDTIITTPQKERFIPPGQLQTLLESMPRFIKDKEEDFFVTYMFLQHSEIMSLHSLACLKVRVRVQVSHSKLPWSTEG